jgi:hypothetical protein
MNGIKDLKPFIEQGQRLLEIEEPVEAHSRFGHWLNNVSNWLSLMAPHAGLAEEWKAIGTSVLLVGSRYYNDKASWNIFRNVVRKRIEWLRKAETGWIRTVQSPNRPDVRQAKPGRILVHGPTGPLRDSVFAFLKKLDLSSFPPPSGKDAERGLPMKDLNVSQVSFAVVLFTGEPSPSPSFGMGDSRTESGFLFALDLGFFLGRIGAKRTCALIEAGLSVPRDLGRQIQMVEADSAGAWQIALARGLKRAGIPLDMNRVL